MVGVLAKIKRGKENTRSLESSTGLEKYVVEWIGSQCYFSYCTVVTWLLAHQVTHSCPSCPHLWMTPLKLTLADLHSSWDIRVLMHQVSPRFCVFPHGLNRHFNQWLNLGWLREQLPIYLFLLTWTFLIRHLIWSWGTSLCFNNTCDKIYLFAFKVVNYGVHFKWAIAAKKSSLLDAYIL